MEGKMIMKKIMVFVLVFLMVFSSCGNTLFAIASSDDFEIVKKGFFEREEIYFDAYIEDESGNHLSQAISDVNSKINVVFDINPLITGYLKEGTIKAVTDDDSPINFKFVTIVDNQEFETKVEGLNEKIESETEIQEEKVELEEPIIENEQENVEQEVMQQENVEQAQEEVVEESNEMEFDISNQADLTTIGDVNEDEIELDLQGNIEEVANNLQVNEYVEEEIQELSEDKIAVSEDNDFVNEEEIINEMLQENEEEVDFKQYIQDVWVSADDEITVENIVNNTKVVVEIEYLNGEKFEIDNLLKNIRFQLSGKFINRDLEEVKIGKQEEIQIGWSYTKDIKLESNYTKFSPFVIGDTQGTIVENQIVVSREVDGENYLPVKRSTLEIQVPTINDKKPVGVDLSASKLMMTNGRDAGFVEFTQDDWTYDEETGIITIIVENEEIALSNGQDEYIIIYRFGDYVDENSLLLNKVKATVESFSTPENLVVTKEINNEDTINADIGELITYNVETSEEKINKSLVNANYNSGAALYEATFTNNVTLNILTSDLIEELKVNLYKDAYLDFAGTSFLARDIMYKTIKFNYTELQNLLSKGGEIVITNINNEEIYTITKDNITSLDDAKVNLNDANGIYMYIRNVAADGILSFEVTKAIGKCNYTKAAFNNFEKMKSFVNVAVKYSQIENEFKLKEKYCEKEFEDSMTVANISMNRDTLSSLKSNENVELKIELNNDKENSDLYVNPMFEIVFPKNITNVSIEGINIFSAKGLKVKDFLTYKEDDIVKIRVELEGMQLTFSDSELTNGTNIIINANVDVNEYTTAKQDQIKLYYCNEGVTRYQSQTKWTINKDVPNDIIKQTNGFDATVFNYQVPDGLVLANTIKNYDGNLSELRSINEGDKEIEIPIYAPSRIATMELVALNNTGKDCTDVCFLGRFPFKGNKDVESGEDLRTNVNAQIVSLIKGDLLNTNIVEVYYSERADANKDLDDISNVWLKKYELTGNEKSFLIVVKGNVKAGDILKFSYDFMIPENLPYEMRMQGSFGATFLEINDDKVHLNSNVADIIGLTTGEGPKLKVTMESSARNGSIGSFRKLDYKVKVENIGSIDATGVEINVPIPEYTTLIVDSRGTDDGNFGYLHQAARTYIHKIGDLPVGETEECELSVYTAKRPTLADMAFGKDENGYYTIKRKDSVDEEPLFDEVVEIDEEGHEVVYKVPHKVEDLAENGEIDWSKFDKVYLTELPPMNISATAIVTSDILAEEVKSNTVSNEFVGSNFELVVNEDYYDGTLSATQEKNFRLKLTNVSDKEQTNVIAEFNMGNLYDYSSAKLDGKEYNCNFDKEKGIIKFELGNMMPYTSHELELKVNAVVQDEFDYGYNSRFDVYADESGTESSLDIYERYTRDFLKAEDISFAIPSQINEGETIVISTKVTNIGTLESKLGTIEMQIDKNVFEVVSAESEGGKHISYNFDSGIIDGALPILKEGASTTIDLTLRALNNPGTGETSTIVKRAVKNENQDDIVLDDVEIKIVNNVKTEEEIEKERVDYLNTHPTSNKNQSTNTKTEDASNNSIPDSTTENQLNNSSSSNNENVNVNTTNNTQENNNSSVPNNTVREEVINTNNSQLAVNKAEDNKTYNISGIAWQDDNENGLRDDDEKGLSNITVYLLNAKGEMYKSTVTNSEGKYRFTGIKTGKYAVASTFDSKLYKVTLFEANGEARNSNVISSKSNMVNAVTNELDVSGSDLNDIDIGLIYLNKFDLNINKYISKAIVETTKGTTEYDLNDEELAKVEIRAREIEGAKVTLEYKIVVENVGDIDGYITNVIDYLPEEMQFDEKQNKDWEINNDGNIKLKINSAEAIQPGAKKEYKLVLTKVMTEDNVGTVLNKVILQGKSNNSVLKDKNSVQTMMILISTGYSIELINFVAVITITAVTTGIIYSRKTKIYYNKTKSTKRLKKVYR